MDKQMIEEMAKDIEIAGKTTSFRNGKIDLTLFKTSEEIAETLYNLNYRKIPENAVVLTKEEYERLKRVETEKDRLYEIKLDLENQLIEKGFTEYVGADEIEKVRKETAEKFAERLKTECFDGGIDDKWVTVSFSRLDEICKEITGEN